MEKNNPLLTDLYCITAEEYSLGRSNTEVVEEWIRAGIKVIQYREKDKAMKEKYQECQKIRELTRAAGVTFIVNDDVDLAMMIGADGVHIGQEDFPLAEVRRLVGNQMIIGISTHSPQEAQAAAAQGADYIGVGPVYKTSTKKNVCQPVGLEYLQYVANHIPLPFVAIGGIKADNIAEVIRTGASCVAMITEITQAQDMRGKINELRELIRKNRGEN